MWARTRKEVVYPGWLACSPFVSIFDPKIPPLPCPAQLQNTRGTLQEAGGGRAATTRLLPESDQDEPFTFAELQATRGLTLSAESLSAQEGDGIPAIEAYIRSRVAP